MTWCKRRTSRGSKRKLLRVGEGEGGAVYSVVVVVAVEAVVEVGVVVVAVAVAVDELSLSVKHVCVLLGFSEWTLASCTLKRLCLLVHRVCS